MTAHHDYISDRINLEQQRREHRKVAPRGCRCHFCITAEEAQRLLAERIRLERLLIEEPPF